MGDERRDGMAEVLEKLEELNTGFTKLNTLMQGNGTPGFFQRVLDNEKSLKNLNIKYWISVGGLGVIAGMMPFILAKIFG
jgi:hypothetical protein